MNHVGPSTPAIVKSYKRPDAELRLFCFSYAGGSAAVFREWAAKLPSWVELCPVELPGHGYKLCEPAYTEMTDLLPAVTELLSAHLDKPFALFGHSLGALIAFEVARAIGGDKRPVCLLVSGAASPPTPSHRPPIYMLPQDAFISSIRQINGTPEELLSNPEMLEIIVPMLRADFSLADQYLCTDRTPLNCPICVYGGAVDAEAPLEDLESWREYTTAGFSLKSFQGDHFFIHTAHTNLLNAISADLFRIVKKQPLQ